MPTVVQNLESATSGVQFVVGQIANAFSPQAKAISDFMPGKPALLASWADLLQKVDDGNATWEDVIQPVLKLEALLSATAILAGTPGAQPAAMILGAVAGSMFIWQNRAAILGAEATIQSFFANRYAQLENSIRDEVGLSRIYEPPVIDFVVNDRFTSARNWTPPSDPLLDSTAGC